MNSWIFFVFLILQAIFLVAFYFLFKKNFKKEENNAPLLMLQNQINELSKIIDLKLGESYKAVQHQFSESAKIIRDVTERLTRLDETNKQVISITDQLKSLQDILKNPKQRGVLGEYYLETVLKNVLPPHVYQMQYEFANGDIVDAVVFVKDKIIPIDSKFSLENYNRALEAQSEEERKRYENAFSQDLKNRIDETAKYVRPEEGTMDFAFMFIPSEAVFYDLLINKVGVIQSNTRDLISYAAAEKKVIIVSPTTFLAYLQTVLQGLRALQIEESAKEIKKRVIDLGKHLLNYENYFRKIGNHLATTVNAYNSAYKELGKIDKDIVKISGKSPEIEVEEIEGPKAED
ncbi:MAG: DNA recombination protein RmuC [Patescibacteria group bacterium]|nr:DNA recombination protein RmuC [Patescibacteria group bacterium]